MARLCGAMKFHRRCGDRVTLLNNNTTAVRNFVEFNHGLIMSAEPLKNDVLFEVCIDRKVNVWNGSLEIGVTTLDPEHVELPATATKLRNTAWIMSGSSIVKDGVTLINSYGPELDTLREADFLGVTRTSKGELMFYINGRCLGVAAKDLPPRLFAVIDLYGQCVQVSIMQGNNLRPIMEASFDQIDEDPNNDDTLTDLDEQGAVGGYPKHVYVPMSADGACALVVQDRLRFHPRCGILVKLSAMNKTAERTRPLDDYNNGVVMTHRPLYDNELFEIRIDKLVDKWSGSIEVGVTTHNPATIRFPSTMTNMESGTIMMSGCKVLFNGHGSCVEYGNFNLDELREGDTVAMMRKDSGELHYYINGVDQGVATDKVESQVWGVVDLYGMTVKVSIVDPCEDVDSNAISSPDLDTSRCRPPIDEDTLLFHTLRDSNVIVFDDGKTAHRPNAFEFFDNGIVMTNRTLRTNELFQVRLDLIVPKWAGSIEIGVTQYSFNELEYPFRITSATSGTWVIAGEDMIRNGAIVIPQYVRNLNRLMEGDMVGVMRKETGILHFYVNGVDQGPSAFNVPENVYGIIDLYGRVAQATITEIYVPPPIYSPDSDSTGSNATTYPEMCFHRAHGRNARLNRNRLTASRTAVYSEFNDAVLFSSRPLRECDMFELRIDKMVDCWIGSLEIGVTAINPEDLEAHGGVGAVAGTATDLVWDTYVLSGAAMMKDGECVRSGYPLDLDTLTVGSRVGMMWHADRSLHYYLDGMDMGKAWYVPHLNIYAVVDLYGQCAQVTILQNEERGFNYNGCPNTSIVGISRALSSPRPPYWSFSEYCGDNVTMLHEYTTARRRTADPTANLVFSSAHLAVDELFEIKIAECKHGYAGSFRMGVTDIDILNAHVNRRLPPAISYLPHFTAYVDGSYIKYSTVGTKKHEKCSFAPSFEWLRPGDRIGLKRTRDARVLLYYNSELLDTAFTGIPEKVYVVMELFGRVTKISAVIRTITAENALIPTTTFATMPGVQVHNAETTETADEDLPVATVTEVVVNEPQVVTMPEPTAAQPTAEVDEAAEPKEDEATTQGAEEEVTEMVASQNEAAALPVSEAPDPRRWRRPLPYTFHYVHGGNVRLCSSDTVAQRISGFDDAIAIVSQPLRRGHNFRFRVDRVSDRWSGSASLGAVVSLPETLLPFNAIHLDPPAWIVSSETYHANGVMYMQDQLWRELEECITEQSVLSIHFRFNGELIVEVNGKMLFNMGIVERSYSHVFPLIDLYGRIEQVSILLHPHVVSGGMSLDLPIIMELEEALSDLENDDEEDDDEPPASPESARKHKKIRAYSHDNLMDEEPVPLLALPGTSSQPDPPPQRGVRARNGTLHQSFILADGTVKKVVNLTLKKSYSSHTFRNVPEDPVLAGSRLVLLRQLSLNVESQVWTVGAEQAAVHEHLNDTNIRHNDRYPEAGDVDNLDSEIIDALTLETGNLPDLSEEQSSSIDESTRRDDIWAGLLAVENMTYLHQLLCLPQEEGAEAEGEGEGEPGARGEGCEHLHLVLKYWRALVQPYPELRRAAAWGLVRCHCANCHPDAPPALAGWVRIERASVGEVVGRRAFWHVARSSLGSAQAQTADAAGPARRPRCLLSMPTHDAPFDDIWLDEDGKPHDTVLVVEIGIDCSEAVNDRLVAFRIYLKAHVAPADDNPSSCDE